MLDCLICLNDDNYCSTNNVDTYDDTPRMCSSDNEFIITTILPAFLAHFIAVEGYNTRFRSLERKILTILWFNITFIGTLETQCYRKYALIIIIYYKAT